MIRLNKVAVRDAIYTVANAAPGVTHDRANGFIIGSRWINGTNEYRCDNDAVGAAVWTLVGSGGGGGGGSTADDITADADVNLTGTTVQSQLTGLGAAVAALAALSLAGGILHGTYLSSTLFNDYYAPSGEATIIAHTKVDL